MANNPVECPNCGRWNFDSTQTCTGCGISLPWALANWRQYVSGRPHMRPPLILLSDDDLAMLKLLSIILKRGGYRVAQTDDSLQTLVLAERLQPDLITTDIMKPHLSGIDLIVRLKSDPVLRDIPVLVVSAIASVEYVRLAKKCGAADIIRKPFWPDHLVHTIAAILGSAPPAS